MGRNKHPLLFVLLYIVCLNILDNTKTSYGNGKRVKQHFIYLIQHGNCELLCDINLFIDTFKEDMIHLDYIWIQNGCVLF